MPSPLKHILVSGHSGAGKSTTAARLSEEFGMPLVTLDNHPDWHAFFRSDHGNVHLSRNTPQRAEFLKLRRRVVNDTFADLKTPSVIEGTQLAGAPMSILAANDRVLVQTPLRQLLQQRLTRIRDKAIANGKPWNADIEKVRADAGRLIYNDNVAAMRRFGDVPGTIKHQSHSDL